jgi:hypothetical protein
VPEQRVDLRGGVFEIAELILAGAAHQKDALGHGVFLD